MYESTVKSAAQARAAHIAAGRIIPYGQIVPLNRRLPSHPLSADELDVAGFPVAANAKRHRMMNIDFPVTLG